MMEAHFFVIIDSRGKCRLCTIPLNAEIDGITSGLPQGLGQATNHAEGTPSSTAGCSLSIQHNKRLPCNLHQ